LVTVARVLDSVDGIEHEELVAIVQQALEDSG
jgi:hypothetical protein